METAARPNNIIIRREGGRLLLLALAALVCWLGATSLLLPSPGLAADKADGELAQTASLFLTMLKAFGALALVLGLIALLAAWLRKMGWGKDAPGRGGSLIKVLDTRMLAPKKFVAVLRIADEFVAVGITDQQINLLTRLEPGEELTATANRPGAQPLGSSFAAILARTGKSGSKDDPSQS